MGTCENVPEEKLLETAIFHVKEIQKYVLPRHDKQICFDCHPDAAKDLFYKDEILRAKALRMTLSILFND